MKINSDQLDTFGQRLRWLRLSYRDTMTTLAQVTACSHAAVSQWEHDRTEPGWAKLKIIAARYSVSLEWLLFGIGQPRTKRAAKSKTSKHKNVGPTFVAEFADGEVTRMSTYTSLEKLDWDRGIRLSQAAYQSRRANARERPQRIHYHTRREIEDALDQLRARHGFTPALPAIVSAHFEQDGKVLAQRNGGGETAP
jgi:transcriptional regulator with XRE-family HTH domain